MRGNCLNGRRFYQLKMFNHSIYLVIKVNSFIKKNKSFIIGSNQCTSCNLAVNDCAPTGLLKFKTNLVIFQLEITVN